jgi:hypothetical protein
MRQRGQICCICLIPLAPPHPSSERRCLRCDHPHRVFLHASHNGVWRVHFLEEDLQTAIGRMFTYVHLDEVRYLLTRGNATAEDREEFETSIRQWNIGGCYLTLTPEQYKKLKRSLTQR